MKVNESEIEESYDALHVDKCLVVPQTLPKMKQICVKRRAECLKSQNGSWIVF